jgi:hypothetical protein
VSNVWKDVCNRIEKATIESQLVYKAMSKNLPKLKTDLNAAKFNVANVGIDKLTPATIA